MTTTESTTEREAGELRQKISDHKAAGARKRAAAEKIVDDEKAKGFNPLTGTSDEDKASFARIDAAYKEADTDFQTASELESRLHRVLDMAGSEARDKSDGDPDHPTVAKFRSLAAPVLASEQYQRLVKSGNLTMEQARVNMDAVEILNREQAKQVLRAGIPEGGYLADVFDGDELVPIDQKLIPPVPMPVRMPRVLELITIGQTDSDTVRWTRQTTRTNAAAGTAFGTPAPKSRYEWERVDSNVRRIPHHVVADKGNLADQGQLRTLIEGMLIEDLRLKVEAEVVAGGGTGQDFTGIYETGSIGSQPLGTDTPADALHKAMTVVRIQLEAEPTAVGISPADFELFWLDKAEDGHYLHHQGPQSNQVRTVWGLPAVISTVFPDGNPITGDFRRGATLWVREGISVAASDQVDDFFLEGLVAVLAQTRAAFGVTQPKAFCEVTDFEEAS